VPVIAKTIDMSVWLDQHKSLLVLTFIMYGHIEADGVGVVGGGIGANFLACDGIALRSRDYCNG
jgi:hypothetical protein